MARPIKAGLDYFELDCHMDEKVELIEAEFGLKGFAEANMEKLGVTSLKDLTELTIDEAAEKLNSRIMLSYGH